MNIKIKLLTGLAVLFTTSWTGLQAQKILPFKLADTGQTSGYTSSQGEDADFVINPLSFTDNGDGTITDNNTGLMWQKTDGGEMIFENAPAYCKNLTLGGYNDWRLPTNHELFSINKYDVINPALNTTYFTKTAAEYWWTSEVRSDDQTKVWVVNAGGGTGAHPKSETVSAGGSKKIHVRAVRNPITTTFTVDHFKDNGDGTIKDNYTGLIWQKIQSSNTMTWEEALAYASGLSLAGKADWRLPNLKELQSLNDEKLSKPSFPKTYFPNIQSGNYWSSTTLIQTTTKSWDINTDYGIVSYNDKTVKEYVIVVRGGYSTSDMGINESPITAGEFEMGDHFGFVDPAHPSDEVPLHKVKLSSFYITTTETTNQQFLTFLNYMLIKGLIEVKNNAVYATGGTDIYCYTNQFASYYSISYDGKVFSMADFRAYHPIVGVMWFGAAAFCNWLSSINGLQECFNLKTWICDFTKNGYRLPTEAEWEFAGRGGNINPYLNYPTGNTLDIKVANLPDSKDPYESTSVNLYPYTTPVGFYDGKNHLKTEFNWPGAASNYQTSNGANGFGLFDMQGNVWEFVYDWYGQNYYSISPSENPKGPDSGFIMPDGKPYRGMRGGNWYNGLSVNGVIDGHSRVSNRNPSYYRGPQDPNHPYYHLGFRIARNYESTMVGISETKINNNLKITGNCPNPFSKNTSIEISVPEPSNVILKVYNSLGYEILTLNDKLLEKGIHRFLFSGEHLPAGLYFIRLQSGFSHQAKQMILSK
jgi:formylglycine-generating enzyme required for sulfatase activity